MLDRFGKLAALASLASLATLAATLGCGPSGSSTSAEPTGAPTASAARPAATSLLIRAATATATATATGTASTSAAAARPLPSPDTHVDAVAWAPAGDRLALWCESGCSYADTTTPPLHVAELPAGTVRTLRIAEMSGSLVRRASFSERGTFVLASAGNNIQIFRTTDLSPVLKLDKGAVYDVMAVSPDEKHFAWADAYGFADVVDLATGKGAGWASLHDPNSGRNQQLAWIPGSPRVVFSCAEECSPELWGTKGKRIAKLKVDGADWTSSQLVTTPGGAIAVAGADGLVALFDGKDGKGSVLRKKSRSFDPALAATPVAIALSGDGKKLAVGRVTGDLTVFDLDTKKATEVLPAKQGGAAVERVALSHDGSRVAFGDYTSSYEVSAVEKAIPEKLDGTSLAYSADGVLLVTHRCSVAGLVAGKEKWRRSCTSTAPNRDSPSVALSPDRKVVAIADGQLHLVRASDGKTATLALDAKAATSALAPQAGTTAADVTAVLGK